MLESVVSQVIATMISAAIVALLQFSYKKYKSLNEWDKIFVLYLFNIAWGILQIFLGIFLVSNFIAKIIFFMLSCVSFAGASLIFFNTIRTIKCFELLIDNISKVNAKNSNNKSDK